jgi:hypothetical protein
VAVPPELLDQRESVMEPGNRPYVDPSTAPGDSGTEEWSETEAGSEEDEKRRQARGPVVDANKDGIADGSPADEFTHDPDAIADRNEAEPG